jgi:hypothetical protein
MTDISTEAIEKIVAAPWCYASEDISATLRVLSAKVTDYEAANDAAEKSGRISDNGNLWRFWADQARHYGSELTSERKTHQAAIEAAVLAERELWRTGIAIVCGNEDVREIADWVETVREGPTP